jgi:hypothetical protein
MNGDRDLKTAALAMGAEGYLIKANAVRELVSTRLSAKPSIFFLCLNGTIPESHQFGFLQHKFCEATIHADQQCGECQDGRLA